MTKSKFSVSSFKFQGLGRSVLLAFLAGMLGLTAGAAPFITATITVTNAPSDGDTVVLNGSTRTFKTTVTVPASQVTIGASAGATATNLFNQVTATPVANTIWSFSSTNVVILAGTNASASKSGTWGTIVLVTNTDTGAAPWLLPATAVTPSSTASNQANQAVAAIDGFATNRFSLASPSLFYYLDLTTAQSVSNKSIFSSLFSGGTNFNTVISNSPSIGGNLYKLTNGYWTNGTGSGITVTNVTIHVDPVNNFHIFDDTAGDDIFVAFPGGIFAFQDPVTHVSILSYYQPGQELFMYANGNISIDLNSTGGHYYDETGAEQLSLSTHGAKFFGGILFTGTETNLVTAGTNVLGGKVAFPRYNNVSLANGNNSAINLGTNVYVVFSGPTGAFTNCGFLAGRDGEIHICENGTSQTMAIADDSGNDPTAANRFFTGLGTGSVVTMTNAHAAFEMIYNTTDSHWRFVGRPPQ